MASLIWSSWPRITPMQSQRLYKYFASHGQIITYKSTKGYTGPTGHGIVVFADAQVAEKLLGDKESTNINLAHIFDPAVTTASASSPSTSPDAAKATTNEQDSGGKTVQSQDSMLDQVKTQFPLHWSVGLKRLDKSPAQVSIDDQLERRYLKVDRERAVMDKFLLEQVGHMKHYRGLLKRVVPRILDETIHVMRELRTRRVRENKERVDKGGNNANTRQSRQTMSSSRDHVVEEERIKK